MSTGTSDLNQKLQILVPEQTPAPGTPDGRSGMVAIATAGIAIPVNVRVTDEYWNLRSEPKTADFGSRTDACSGNSGRPQRHGRYRHRRHRYPRERAGDG